MNKPDHCKNISFYFQMYIYVTRTFAAYFKTYIYVIRTQRVKLDKVKNSKEFGTFYFFKKWSTLNPRFSCIFLESGTFHGMQIFSAHSYKPGFFFEFKNTSYIDFFFMCAKMI